MPLAVSVPGIRFQKGEGSQEAVGAVVTGYLAR